MNRIAVIGSNMVDLITYVDRMPEAGETLEAPRFSLGCGGKGANQAVAAAKLGADVVFVTRVGDDFFADGTIANLQACGIDTRHVRKVPGASSGVAPIFVRPDSGNSILIIKGANAAMDAIAIKDAADALKQSSLIVLQLEIAIEVVYAAIDFAAEHGIPVLLNPAPAVAGLDPARLAKLDFLAPNETELALLSGMPVTSLETAQAAARSLVDNGCTHIIATLGEKGALYVGCEGEWHIPACRVNAVDTTGAGDAFVGCFAKVWSETHDIRTAMEEAVAYSACSVTAFGTQSSYPDSAAFERFRDQRTAA
ncbi:ribokinase [Gluconobacter kanchanaburiensis]|uniref:Deoxyribokinase n=1 Tax=Gluconobacter kanchanaburiensis NBRC 103587 TaxID=1307948 RepID=A0A511B461_9PROT|nr:ribokinase [Gluconobacter kanchanaburiensis]MBF0861589.1 ribokinase [Gluconobacter kanchanaburiensis]GBR67033.1 1-phosphofructokinase [Gluconobacter kanchanaburiensis NBRC 103587]GEK95230.1 ribokinase [Gluconobacter kanchanaburiensis NBRC 103587]